MNTYLNLVNINLASTIGKPNSLDISAFLDSEQKSCFSFIKILDLAISRFFLYIDSSLFTVLLPQSSFSTSPILARTKLVPDLSLLVVLSIEVNNIAMQIKP